MSDALEVLIGELRRRRTHEGRSACLSDAALEALAEDTLSPSALAGARDHVAQCLVCLRAYAEVRSLLEASRVVEPEAFAAGVSAGIRRFVRRGLAARIPVPWVVAAVAASALLTWMSVAGIGWGPMRVSPPPSTVELAGADSRTVTGKVESVRDATSSGMTAHVIRVRDAGGAGYAVFVWGAPSVGAGDAVTIQGVFSPLEGSTRGSSYQGVATNVRRHASQ